MESSKGLTRPVPARHLKTPPMIEAAKKAMREHGCVIVEDGEHCVGEPDPDLRKEEGLRLFLWKTSGGDVLGESQNLRSSDNEKHS